MPILGHVALVGGCPKPHVNLACQAGGCPCRLSCKTHKYTQSRHFWHSGGASCLEATGTGQGLLFQAEPLGFLAAGGSHVRDDAASCPRCSATFLDPDRFFGLCIDLSAVDSDWQRRRLCRLGRTTCWAAGTGTTFPTPRVARFFLDFEMTGDEYGTLR